MKKATAVFSACIVALCAWVIYLTTSLRKSIISHDIGPAVYPRLLCYALIGLSVLLFVSEVLIGKNNAKLKFLSWTNVLHIAVFAVFLFSFEYIGFPICAFLILCFMMRIMGCPKWWETVLVALVASLAIYLIFKKLLLVRLPLGILKYIFA